MISGSIQTYVPFSDGRSISSDQEKKECKPCPSFSIVDGKTPVPVDLRSPRPQLKKSITQRDTNANNEMRQFIALRASGKEGLKGTTEEDKETPR